MGLAIRIANTNDAPGIRTIYAPFITQTAVSFEMEVPTVAEFESRISGLLQNLPWLVCEVDGVIAGYAYGSDHRARAAYQWSKEVSVYVHPDYHKRGIANGLYTSLLAVLKAQGVCNVLAGITLPNEASTRFHEQYGFTSVGVYHRVGYKMGQWHDTAWHELPLSHEEPAALIPLPQMPETVVVEALRTGLTCIKA